MEPASGNGLLAFITDIPQVITFVSHLLVYIIDCLFFERFGQFNLVVFIFNLRLLF
jgi:hypothetical protein